MTKRGGICRHSAGATGGTLKQTASRSRRKAPQVEKSTAGSRFRHFERNAQKNLVEMKKSSTFA